MGVNVFACEKFENRTGLVNRPLCIFSILFWNVIWTCFYSIHSYIDVLNEITAEWGGIVFVLNGWDYEDGDCLRLFNGSLKDSKLEMKELS